MVTRRGFPGRRCAPVAPVCGLIGCDHGCAGSVVGALLRDVGVGTGALEASVGVLAVVEGHAVDTQHVGLQVSLLGGAVGAVAALERPSTCREEERN